MCTFFVFKWFSTVSAQIFSESSFPNHSRELNEMNTVPVPIFQTEGGGRYPVEAVSPGKLISINRAIITSPQLISAKPQVFEL